MNRRISGHYNRASSRSKKQTKKTSQNRIPERIPITMEYLACLVAKESRGEKVNHPIYADMMEILHDSIFKMVESYVWKYCTSSSVENKDLFQECMKKIFSSIGNYDPVKGKFTTWSSTVCFSVLNREYKKRIQWESHVVQNEDMLTNCVDENSTKDNSAGRGMLAQDIVGTIKFMIKKYPKYRNLIFALFGDPQDKNYTMPTELKIDLAAKRAGVSPPTAKAFLRNIVRPCFQKRFLSLTA